MGFPSPASDYVEHHISLDQELISKPSATYFMRASCSHFREGIPQGGAACRKFFVIAVLVSLKKNCTLISFIIDISYYR